MPVLRAGFSLVEILVVMGLLSFIIIGLLMMFTQTQRAFKQGMSQVDVLESGRAFTDMIARELSEMTPSGAPTNVNFFARIDPNFWDASGSPPLHPLLQGLPGTTTARTNVIEQFYFLNYGGRTMSNLWTAIGYEVVPDYPNTGVGTLYRFSATAPEYQAGQLFAQFSNSLTTATATAATNTSCHRIADGIVHLRIRAFATNGFPILGNMFYTNAVFRTNGPNSTWGFARVYNTDAAVDANYPDDLRGFDFQNTAVPAYVEIEIGVLEPQILDRFNAIGTTGNAARQYLLNHVAEVHLFHQRIPVHAVNATAY